MLDQDIDDGPSGSGGQLPKALKRYFETSGVALSLARVEGNDVPLILANAPFYRLTGYAEDEVVGRNCRFLQGDKTTEASKRALHDFIHNDSAEAGRFPILNYRKDGSTFHNFVFMSRLRDSRKQVRFILASQFDLSSAVRHVGLEVNDAELGRNLNDIEAIGRGYGLAMIASAQMLSDSVAMIAQLSMGKPD